MENKTTSIRTSTHSTKWGDDRVEVIADWAQAADTIRGDLKGYQVADFRHSWRAALRRALEELATCDGLNPDDPETETLIDEAMMNAR
jgi:hypothetical protein